MHLRTRNIVHRRNRCRRDISRSGEFCGRPSNLTIGDVTSTSQYVNIAGSFGGSEWNWTFVDGSDVANVYLAYESPPEEAFFGLGEQTGIGNLRGWRVPVWTREGGAGRGEEPITSVLNANPSVSGQFAGGSLLTTYTAVASLTSSLGRWIVLDGTSYALFNLASNATSPFQDTAKSYLAGDIIEGDRSASSSTTVEIQYEGSAISGWLGRVTGGNVLLDAIGALTTVTGRQPTLPDWVNDGAILGIQGGQELVEGVIRDAQNASLPLASVWLQDWSGTRLQAGAYGIDVHRLWWNWEPDTTLYPTWAEWVPYLQEQYDVRTLSYVNTFLANVSSKSTGYNSNFYDIAQREARLVTNTTAEDDSVWTITSGVGIDAGILDLSNQTTVDWFKDLVKKQFYSVPISGGMQDFGEYLAVDDSVSLSHSTVDPRVCRNAYPTVWASILRENIDASREDGLRAVVSSALHIGASGFAHTHSDVGGYTTILSAIGNLTRSAALLGRWGELSAFSDAAFRTHEGNIPQVNVQAYTNASTLAYHAYNTRLFRSLKKYRVTLQAEYQAKGWPVLRHPIVYSPNDSTARSVIDESFWVGEALYVAPVYDVRATALES
ncbi:glycosyl hydrolase, putative [Phytophthora infestans T30-4]|uniref:Glycosyl hydrolase, putative n=1 Tax=Phytophthora infestans (strain T30-4) TaxID=403677 RepID=D0NMB7_PHYIT|nr:glycosyl hydrolase, putative [Phytophthora infestans T30-4]EEY60838.1 glycosyl hydrolase, putative [Phytophthora infestans T30-4]|eukprot:XP_002899784.1 glycosyl hydrolase, putative [Phytophthora infestans T30-4]